MWEDAVVPYNVRCGPSKTTPRIRYSSTLIEMQLPKVLSPNQVHELILSQSGHGRCRRKSGIHRYSPRPLRPQPQTDSHSPSQTPKAPSGRRGASPSSLSPRFAISSQPKQNSPDSRTLRRHILLLPSYFKPRSTNKPQSTPTPPKKTSPTPVPSTAKYTHPPLPSHSPHQTLPLTLPPLHSTNSNSSTPSPPTSPRTNTAS